MNKAGAAILDRYWRAFEQTYMAHREVGYARTRKKIEEFLQEAASKTKDIVVLAQLHRYSLSVQATLAFDYEDLRRMRALTDRHADLGFRTIMNESIERCLLITLTAREDPKEARALLAELKRSFAAHETMLASAKKQDIEPTERSLRRRRAGRPRQVK